MSIFTSLIVDMIKEANEKNECLTLSDIAEKMKKELFVDNTRELIEFIDDAILSENIEFCVVDENVDQPIPADEEERRWKEIKGIGEVES